MLYCAPVEFVDELVGRAIAILPQLSHDVAKVIGLAEFHFVQSTKLTAVRQLIQVFMPFLGAVGGLRLQAGAYVGGMF